MEHFDCSKIIINKNFNFLLIPHEISAYKLHFNNIIFEDPSRH